MSAPDRRIAAAIAAIGLLMAAWLAATVALVWSVLSAPERDAVADALAGRAPLAVMTWLGALGVAAVGLHFVHRHFVRAPGQLVEEARVLLDAGAERELAAGGSAENRALADVVNELVRQRAQLRRDIDQEVRRASHAVEQERNRLAALMSELTQSVVVCNLDGVILLYNGRARAMYRALSRAPAVAGGAELVGLGRSIYAVFDRRLVSHALESVAQRLRRGQADASAQFVTAAGDRLLRVQVAPVRDVERAAEMAGFVLMLDDVTGVVESESARDRLLTGLTEGSRASLANMQAAVDMLEYPDLDPGLRERFQAVVRDEVRAMARRLQESAADAARGLKTRWPMEDMLGADLVAAAVRRIEAGSALRASAVEVDADVWLRVDSFSLLQAVSYLTARLADEFGLRSVQLRLAGAGPQRAHLDVAWFGQAMSTETVMSWELDSMRVGDEAVPLSVRDVVERHGGEFWFERARARHEAFFRFLLPRAADARADAEPAALAPTDSRPEYYDFDLFGATGQSHALDERPLAQLTFTVFDTETTGLQPLQGDEIIQIGAARVVNGRLLRTECFEQLVDPRRSIPEQTIPIHGIRPEMVRGQPPIEQVLPAFHAFAQDTVLVAHNAAFDMQFVQMKQRAAGVAFEQPVLDTLLLSAVVHPNQASHRLEAVAERLGVPVTGRHTALGDAMVTAEILLRLIPLLARQGIVTLGQAREAAQQTMQARLSA